MKIGIEATTLSRQSTGTNRFLNCLFEQLEKTPNSIIRLTPSVDFFDRHRISNRIKKNWYRNFGIKKDINKSDLDCIIFPDYYIPHNFKKPSAIIIHDLSFITHPQFYSKKFTLYYDYQINQTLKQKPFVVTISEHSKEKIHKYLGVKEEDILILQGYSKLHAKILTSRNSISEPLNSYLKENSYLLYVGRIEPRKNLNFLIEGFLKWKNSQQLNYKLKIVGEVWIKSRSVADLLNKYSNHPDIDFTGYVTEEQLEEIYSGASGFIHTSFEEGFGFPVLEAMSYKLPILCTKGIATEEISRPKSITVDPINSESYMEGLDKLQGLILNEKRIDYKIKYTPEQMCGQLNELLERLSARVTKIYRVNIPKAKTHEEAIEKTLVYSGLFNAGIREVNLHKQIFDLQLTKEEMATALENLLLKEIINKQNDLIELKNNDEGYYKKKKKVINDNTVHKILNFLHKLPLVSQISFSGGTANYGIHDHDDIDLFIITRPYTVYIVYFIIHIYSVIFRLRKELCVNYLIDEINLHINHSYDLYTAQQIISLISLKNQNMINKFWNENEWVKKYFPNFEIGQSNYEDEKENRNDGITEGESYSTSDSDDYSLFRFVNKVLMIFYKFLYRNKIKSLDNKSSVILTEHCMKLHSHDHKSKIINEFKKAWDNYLKNNSRLQQNKSNTSAKILKV
jgi:glycosyltransferase involved in cell wall biosynthesis